MYFLEVIKDNVQKFPNRCAVCFNHGEQALTYGALWEDSGKVYAYLKNKKIGREDIVLVHMPRDPRVYVYVLGIIRLGAAFTVVETTSPEERLEFIKKDSGAAFVLSEEMFAGIMKEEPIEGYEPRDPHDAAFAVYTSGTTGTPKGVLHEYGNIDLEIRYHRTLATENGERFASILPIGFVAFVMEFTQQLTYGNTIFIVDYSISKNLNSYSQFLAEEQIESIHLPPSMFRRLQNLSPSVRKVKVGTEPANGLYMENVQITNNYAQSETYFTIANIILDRKYDKAPVGKNPVGIEIKILDEDGNPVENGVTGEICFKNEFFRGYINLKEQTEYAFRDGIYHTGDLGYINAEGNLVISGRRDDMIKINGNRIEPAEIEAAGKRVLGVNQAVAKGFAEDSGRSYVALYYVRNEGMEKLTREDEIECIKKISEILPKYMVPAYLIEIDKIPTVPNGKTDRKALPKPDTSDYMAEYEAPEGEFEEKLCKAIQHVLGIEKIGRNDDFYALGGDSLTSMEVVTEVDLPDFSTTDIFRGRIISRISELYSGKKSEDTNWEKANEEAMKNEYPLTFEMKRFFDLQLFRPKSALSVNRNLVRFPLEKIDIDRFKKALETVVRHFSMFGTVIAFNDNCELVQKYDSEKIKEIRLYEMKEEELDGFLESKFGYFTMLNDTFFELFLIKTEKYLYFMNQNHHIAFDGTCNILLAEAVTDAYNGMPLRPDTYYLYLDRLKKSRTPEFNLELDKYYRNTFTKKEYQRYLEPDMETKLPELDSFLQPGYPFSVTELKKASKSLGGTPGIVAFAAVLMAFARCAGKKDIIALIQYNSRDDLLSNNTFGLLARSLPVAVEFENLKTVGDLIGNLKYSITQGMAYDCMEKLIGKDTPFDTECLTYVYEGELGGIGKLAELGGEPVPVDPPHDAPRDFAILFFENGEDIMSVTAFRNGYHGRDRVKQFQDTYIDILCELVNNKDAGSIELEKLI